MNFDKRTMMAFLFIGLIIILTQSDWYKKTFFPELYKQEKSRKERVVEQNNITPSDSLEKQIVTEKTVSTREKYVEPVSHSVQYEELLSGVENEIRIETDLYDAVLSNKGGRLKSFRLKKYLTKDSTYVELMRNEGKECLDITFENADQEVRTFEYYFTSVGNSAFVKQGKNHQIKYVVDFGNGRKIEKVYTFYGHQYDFDLEVSFINFGDLIARPYYEIRWGSGMASTEQSLKDDMQFAKAYAMIGEEVQDYDVKNKSDEEEKIQRYGDGNVKWAGQRTKYFSAVIIPDGGKAKQVIFGGYKEEVVEQNDFLKVFSVNMEMPYLERSAKIKRDKFKIFLGPLDYELVKSYDVGLDKMMSWGWDIIKPFSMAVLWSLKKLHSFIPNYGLVIILFSILVKILLYPLTHKSYKSMHAMQSLQPKVSALKEKYGKDQKRLNEETMKLYKTEGVNPVGGCLPMFLQMPILYSLFIIFRSTIELRSASFFWWINDLSMADTIFTLGFNIPMYGDKVNVLPIIMGLTMFFQQKMSMKDPKQKAMVYMMPVFFTLLFNQFPSGLNLYYSLFNVFSIFQQKFATDSKPKQASIPEPKKPEIKRRKK